MRLPIALLPACALLPAEIYGHEDVKKALLLAMVGGVSKVLPDGMKLRGGWPMRGRQAGQVRVALPLARSQAVQPESFPSRR